MKTKLIIAVLLLAVAAAAAVYWKPAPKTDDQNVTNDQPEEPKFVMGVITSVDQKQMVIRSSGELKTAVIGDFSQLLKQDKQKDGLIKINPAQISDYKVGSTVIVFYEQDPQGQVYQATKIQKID